MKTKSESCRGNTPQNLEQLITTCAITHDVFFSDNEKRKLDEMLQ
jgi:hypothetical protein